MARNEYKSSSVIARLAREVSDFYLYTRVASISRETRNIKDFWQTVSTAKSTSVKFTRGVPKYNKITSSAPCFSAVLQLVQSDHKSAHEKIGGLQLTKPVYNIFASLPSHKHDAPLNASLPFALVLNTPNISF